VVVAISFNCGALIRGRRRDDDYLEDQDDHHRRWPPLSWLQVCACGRHRDDPANWRPDPLFSIVNGHSTNATSLAKTVAVKNSGAVYFCPERPIE
jgi:hypothetical protein